MKIKALVMAVILSITAAGGAHALGLGAQFNFSAGSIFAPGAALVISPSRTVHLAVNWYLASEETSIVGLTLDLVPLVLPLSSFSAGTFNFTLGVGLFTNMVFANDTGFDGGLRVPLGVNLMLGRNSAFEIYTHVAPSFGVHFLPSMGLSSPFFPIALGARLWFS